MFYFMLQHAAPNVAFTNEEQSAPDASMWPRMQPFAVLRGQVLVFR